MPVLHAIVTGSPAAAYVGRLVTLATEGGWRACVIASPQGRRFVNVAALEAQTGFPVRSEYEDFGTPPVHPPADVLVAAPITCNSLAKWAAGISDTLALGLLVEAVAKGVPVVAMPFSNRPQLEFQPIREARMRLAEWGVDVVLGPGRYEPHDPGAGPEILEHYPWESAWEAARSRVQGA